MTWRDVHAQSAISVVMRRALPVLLLVSLLLSLHGVAGASCGRVRPLAAPFQLTSSQMVPGAPSFPSSVWASLLIAPTPFIAFGPATSSGSWMVRDH